MGMRRRHKYGAEKITVDGIVFDSKREATRYSELKILLRAGKIRDLILQPAFRLGTDDAPVVIRSNGFPNGRRVQYRADFKYFDLEAGREVVEDSKGFDTPAARLKRAFVEWQYSIKIELV